MATPTPNVPKAVLQEARRLVNDEPSIEAVILFGSRARGDAHPESDYDLAVVTTAANRDARVLCKPLAELDETIQIVPVDPEALRTYRNTCNRVERGVVVDGQTLAGTWHRPPHQRKADDMDHKAFEQGFRAFVSHARSAIADIALAEEEAEAGSNHGAYNAFRAGEHAAKGILTLYGLTHRKSHEVNDLAEQLRSARRGSRDQEQRNHLAARIEQLNGNAKELNTLDYAIEIFEPNEASQHRLILAAELADECLGLYAERATGPSRKPTPQPDTHARTLQAIARQLYFSQGSLHKHPDRRRLSAETNTAIERLCKNAAKWSQSQDTPTPSQTTDNDNSTQTGHHDSTQHRAPQASPIGKLSTPSDATNYAAEADQDPPEEDAKPQRKRTPKGYGE